MNGSAPFCDICVDRHQENIQAEQNTCGFGIFLPTRVDTEAKIMLHILLWKKCEFDTGSRVK